MSQTKTQRSLVRMSPSFQAQIDAWCLEQPDTPSRAEGIRRLVSKGLMLDARKKEAQAEFLARSTR